MQAVTKLRNETYLLSQTPDFGIRKVSSPAPAHPPVMYVFEDQNPYRFQRKFELTEMSRWKGIYGSYINDIKPNEKENCLYVSSYENNCIWKITREAGDQHIIIKWLTTDFKPTTLSVTNDGHLLLINEPILMIYGSDAELIRSIHLPGDIENVRHAVETHIGNFIIIHRCTERKSLEDEEGIHELQLIMDLEECAPSVSKRLSEWYISEVTNDGHTVRRSSNDSHSMRAPVCISHDSGDRVFVAGQGTWNTRVTVLDSDLKRSLIHCPTVEDNEQEDTSWLWRLFLDEEKKQLIEGKYNGINIYKLSHV